MSEKYQGKAVKLTRTRINTKTQNPENHNFTLYFKVKLYDDTSVNAGWTVFYKKEKAKEFAAKIIESLKPDLSQGNFEELFTEKRIDYESYFKGLPRDVELVCEPFKDKEGNERQAWKVENWGFAEFKYKDLTEVPFRFNNLKKPNSDPLPF